jgi:HK97 family phage portal protein
MRFNLARALEGKALSDNPVFHDGVPTSVYSPGASRQDALISQREAKRHGEAYGGLQAMDWIMDCVDLYAETVSMAEWELVDEDNVPMVRKKLPDTPPDYKVGPDALYRLLDKPNPHMRYDELLSLLVIDYMLVGNAYWLEWQHDSLGRPLGLYRLAPAYVQIVPGAFGPKSYKYQPPGAKDPLEFTPDLVTHFKRPNPNDAYYGMGIIKGGGKALDIELSITDTMRAYYENKADPSLIVQSDRRVPRDVFNKLRAQLRARVSGSSRAGELLVLEAGLKASTLSPSARDALFMEVSRMSRDRIFAMFRASPKLFGILDEAGGSDKVSDARREFDTYVIRPFMDRVQRAITDSLARKWDVKYRINYRYTMPLEELIKNVGTLAAVPGIKVREIRRQLGPLGITESTGDKKIDEEILNMPLPDLGPNGTGAPGAGADRNLPGEAGRPPLGKNTTSFGTAAGKALDFDEVLSELAELEARAGARARLEGKALKDTNKIAAEKRPKDLAQDERNAEVDDIATFIQNGLADAARLLERGLLDNVEGKAFRPNDLRSRLRRSNAWKTFNDAVEKVLTEAALRAASAATMQSGVTPDDDLDYDAIAASVVKRPQGLRSIISTMKRRLLTKTSEKLVESDVTQQMVEATIQEHIREWTAPDGWASKVAISEAVEAYNEGTLSVAESLGHSHVFVTDGDQDDAPCAEADGQVWDLDHARANRKEHPNCRRAFLLMEQNAA